MSRLIVILLLPLAALAGDRFPATAQLLAEARAGAFEPGARARVYPVLEEMIGLADSRSIKPLAEFLLQTLQSERSLFETMFRIQRRGADAHKQVVAIDKELQHLRIRLKAGAHDVAPVIEERKSERKKMNQVFETVQDEVRQYDKAVTFARDVREKLVRGCAVVLHGLDGEALAFGLGDLRRVLDVAHPIQALLLVRILRSARKPETAPYLVDLVVHPRIARAARDQAIVALALLKNPVGIQTLIKLWERDPEGAGRQVRYAFSLAARRPISGPGAAHEWAQTLAK